MTDIETCRNRGKKLFSAFDQVQQRIIQAELLSGGRPNHEERTRLRAVVAALRQWVPEAKELGILPQFEREIRLFIAFLKHEAREEALAAKVRMPIRTELFLESGTDVAAPASKPIQHLDFDVSRLY